MAVRDRADIAASLKRKGFVLGHGKKRDHDYYFFDHPGLTTHLFTKLSRGSGYKTYSSSLLADVSAQLKLSNPQLLQLIDCPMSAEEYLQILIDAGVIDKNALESRKRDRS